MPPPCMAVAAAIVILAESFPAASCDSSHSDMFSAICCNLFTAPICILATSGAGCTHENGL